MVVILQSNDELDIRHCQNGKQGRPIADCSNGAVCSGSTLFAKVLVL